MTALEKIATIYGVDKAFSVLANNCPKAHQEILGDALDYSECVNFANCIECWCRTVTEDAEKRFEDDEK